MILSLFSVSYAGGWGQSCLDVPAFIAKAAELGYPAVMLAGKRPHVSTLDATPQFIDRVESALNRHNIACHALAAYTDLAPALAVEVPYIEMQIGYVESLAQLAHRLGARWIRVFTAYEREDAAPLAIWNGVVQALQEMCDRAAAHGVGLAVQNHHDIAVHSEALLELLADVDRPNCKLGYDAWSPALRGEDLFDAARRMAPHTAMTTNADYVRLPRFRYEPRIVNYQRVQPDMVRAVKFGAGFIDYAAFFSGLAEGGFSGLASYEMCSPLKGGGSAGVLDDHAAAYLTWMRRHTASANS